MPGDGRVTLERVKAILSYFSEIGRIKPPLPSPERFVDIGIVEEIKTR